MPKNAFCLIAIVWVLAPVSLAVARTNPPHIEPPSRCLGAPSTDKNLDAILEVVFRDTPRRLFEQKTIPPEFYAAVRDARFEVCRDRTWDVVTFPTKPPLVVFDYDLMTMLARESQTLLVGQHLATTYPGVGTLDLHAHLMEYILKQNQNLNAPPIEFSELINQFMGKPVDVRQHMQTEQFSARLQTTFLQTVYFLIFHEFCHIQARHLQRRADIESLPDTKIPSGKTKLALRAEIEKEADSCALDTINRDEARGKLSPISFVSAFMVVSTQGLYERLVPRKAGDVTHPAPRDRLENAYQRGLALIANSPDAARYRETLDGAYEHFLRVNALK